MMHLNRLLSRQLQLATHRVHHHHHTPSRHFAKRSPKLPELEAAHIPVMKDEVLRLWAGDDGSSNKHLIDGTIGLGGHSLAAIEAGSKVLGIDRDSYILRAVKRRLDAALQTHDDDDDGESDATHEAAQQQEEEPHDKPYALHHGSYADLSSELLQSHSFPPTVDGILLDLGANTYQLENAVRGFTFRRQGPLDMRFDAPFADHTGTRRKAYDIVNTYTVEELASLFDRYADEPYAMPIARAIVRWRTEKNFERSKKDKKHSRKSKGIVSTLELRYVIEAAIASHRNTIQRPAVLEHKKRPEDKHYRYRKIWRHHDQGAMTKNKRIKKLLKMYEEDKVRKADHVARCFQALRIETNDELNHLNSFLSNLDTTTNTLENLLNAGGRLVAIAFQPGEDGLVRNGMEAMVRSGKFRWITPEEEGMRPSEEEVKVNGKARTARLRAVEKIK